MSARTLNKVIHTTEEERVGSSLCLWMLVTALSASLVGCDGTRDETTVLIERQSQVVELVGWTSDEQALLIRMVGLSGSGDALEATCDSTGMWMVRLSDQRASRFGGTEWCKRTLLITAAAFEGSRDLLAYAGFDSPEGLTLHSGRRDIELALRGCGGQVHGLALAAGSNQFAVVGACDGDPQLLVGRLPESPSEGQHVTLAAIANGVRGRPSWLGRSARIAVALADSSEIKSIIVVDTSGKSLAVVHDGLSPAGSRESPDLLFLRDPEPQSTPRHIEVWISDGAVGPERQLASVEFCGASSAPARVDVDLVWSPSGSLAAVRAGSCIWLVRNLAGTPQVAALRSR